MKIFQLKVKVHNEGFAFLRPSNEQYVNEVDLLDVWWDDWGSGGDKIGDFVFCYGVNVCKASIFKVLKSKFRELKGVDLKYNKTDKEINAKKPERLKWLPKEEIPLQAFFSPESFDCLPVSTVKTNERGIIKIEGVSELRGNLIIPREEGRGLFFSSEVVGDYDFFSLKNSGFLLCTERVKKFCEEKNYENVIFLEAGDII